MNENIKYTIKELKDNSYNLTINGKTYKNIDEDIINLIKNYEELKDLSIQTEDQYKTIIRDTIDCLRDEEYYDSKRNVYYGSEQLATILENNLGFNDETADSMFKKIGFERITKRTIHKITDLCYDDVSYLCDNIDKSIICYFLSKNKNIQCSVLIYFDLNYDGCVMIENFDEENKPLGATIINKEIIKAIQQVYREIGW